MPSTEAPAPLLLLPEGMPYKGQNAVESGPNYGLDVRDESFPGIEVLNEKLLLKILWRLGKETRPKRRWKYAFVQHQFSFDTISVCSVQE